MSPSSPAQEANLDPVAQVGALIGTGFADPDEDLFAPDFVFHFVNPHLPDLHGEHHGLDGMRRFFERLQQTSDTGFHNEPHSLTPYGNELVVAYATNTLSFGGTEQDVDAARATHKTRSALRGRHSPVTLLGALGPGVMGRSVRARGRMVGWRSRV